MTSKPLGLDAVQDVKDPIDRAHEAARLASYAEATAELARKIRDTAIVDAYAVGGVTRGRLAELVGVTESVVVAALRRR